MKNIADIRVYSALAGGRRVAYVPFMSYMTVEVKIDHGQISAKGSDCLPERASGLLIIFPTAVATPAAASQLQALESLQRRLGLDEVGAERWMAAVPEARR